MATAMIEIDPISPPSDLDIFGRRVALPDAPAYIHRHKPLVPVFDQGLLDRPFAIVGFQCECGALIER